MDWTLDSEQTTEVAVLDATAIGNDCGDRMDSYTCASYDPLPRFSTDMCRFTNVALRGSAWMWVRGGWCSCCALGGTGEEDTGCVVVFGAESACGAFDVFMLVFAASVLALVTPVMSRTSMAGHQRYRVFHSWSVSAMSATWT